MGREKTYQQWVRAECPPGMLGMEAVAVRQREKRSSTSKRISDEHIDIQRLIDKVQRTLKKELRLDIFNRVKQTGYWRTRSWRLQQLWLT
ncbi:hypothetical protein O9993_08670 [Vibrio lentus]|nr:hypothetical protein [Vibrio lentus]